MGTLDVYTIYLLVELMSCTKIHIHMYLYLLYTWYICIFRCNEIDKYRSKYSIISIQKATIQAIIGTKMFLKNL